MLDLDLGHLPPALQSVQTQALFVMRLDVRPLIAVGATPGANRRIGVIFGGEFKGARLSGTVLDGGSDWQSLRADGSTALDVKLVLQTHDDALITMNYRGLRHGPADVMKRIQDGAAVDASSYYFRIHPSFETADPRYDFLNRVLAVGVGHRLPEGPVYSVFEVL